MRLDGTFRTCSSWNAAHARPASAWSLMIVLTAVSVIREIDRSDEPSTSILRIAARFAVLSLFVLVMIQESTQSV